MFYSVLVDETKDVSKVEQLSVVRYVDVNTVEIHERFLTYVPAESLTADSLTTYILVTLSKMNLKPENIVSQGYDGASVMSGRCSGVQARIQQIVPQAVYIHCNAHCLNLALVDSVKGVKVAAEFFVLLQTLYVFMSCSKAHVKYINWQKQLHSDKQPHQLQRLSDTRWACLHSAIAAVCYTFDSILATLADIEQDGDAQKSTEARGLLYQINFFQLDCF